jgi:hypothetical protein
MIKSLADVVYRATNEEKIGEHNSKEVLTTIISDLDALAVKGVHGDRSLDDDFAHQQT